MPKSFAEIAILVALTASAACSSLLGLEPTVGDSDGDGIVDGADNCVDAPNPGQFDSDGDGVGDSCATCGSSISIDLDGDGYDDGCDRCIGAGPVGADADGDGLDDGCDPCTNGVGVTGVDVMPVDGIDDGCTYCHTPIGADVDDDGLDDGCDRCTLGPPNDEDRDGSDDDCDSCPGDRNPDQAPGSDVGIGAACDPYSGRNERADFDPFLVRGAGLTGGGTVTGGTLVFDASGIASTGREASNTFRVALGVRPLSNAQQVASIVTDGMTTSASVSCSISGSGELTLITDDGIGPAEIEILTGVAVGESFELVFNGPIDSDLVPTTSCVALRDGAVIGSVSKPAGTSRWTVSVGGAGVSLDWLDIITGL